MSSENVFKIDEFSIHKNGERKRIYAFSCDDILPFKSFNEQFTYYRRMSKEWNSLFNNAIDSEIDKSNLHMFNMYQDILNYLLTDIDKYDSFVIKFTNLNNVNLYSDTIIEDIENIKEISDNIQNKRKTQEDINFDDIIELYTINDKSLYSLSFNLHSKFEKDSPEIWRKKYYMLSKIKDRIRNPCFIEIIKCKSKRTITPEMSDEEIQQFKFSESGSLIYNPKDENIGIANLYLDFRIFLLFGFKIDNIVIKFITPS